MPVPAAVTRINRKVTNPLLRRAAGVAPGMGVLRHTGRRSGRIYEAPVMVFGGRPTWYIILTYGPDRDWIKNLQHSGSGELVHNGRTVAVSNPRFVTEAEALPSVSKFGRLWRTIMRAPEFFAVDESQ